MLGLRSLSIVIGAVIGLTGAEPVFAGTGPWLKTEAAALRMVTMRDAQSGQVSAALEVALEPGWKTYWRSPGASGLPLQIDFSTSTNVSEAEVHHPTPIIFAQGSSRTAGYEGRTIFPLSVTLDDPRADATLSAMGLIGVCRDICVPLQFDLSVTDAYPGVTSFAAAETINTGFAQLPQRASESFGVERISWDESGPALVVEARLPNHTKEAALFLEGPPSWYLEPAKPTSMADGTARFEIPLPRGAKPGDVGSDGLTATLVADGIGVEHKGLSLD